MKVQNVDQVVRYTEIVYGQYIDLVYSVNIRDGNYHKRNIKPSIFCYRNSQKAVNYRQC